MPLSIDKTGISDLVRPLSPEALDYFSSIELSDEWPSYENGLFGKYVRFGVVIVLGATIPYGPPNRFTHDRKVLTHNDIIRYARSKLPEDVEKAIIGSTPREANYLERSWSLSDTGRFRIGKDDDGHPDYLEFTAGSIDYGVADEELQHQTVAVARKILGQAVTVELR